MKTLIVLFLVITAFYKHGTPQNFWYQLGKLSKELF